MCVFPGIPSVCKQVVSVETTRDIEWATHTCTLGFQVFGKWRLIPSPSLVVCFCFNIHSIDVSAALLCSSGLWPDGSDGTDVNAVCRSSDKSLLVTGDDFGKVHLFSYPCSQFRVRYCVLSFNIFISVMSRRRSSSCQTLIHSSWKGKIRYVLFYSGSQPCLRRPQQSRDQCDLPVWRWLPGVNWREGHERDAVEDSLREQTETDTVGFLLLLGPEAQLRQTELNCTKLNQIKLKLTQTLKKRWICLKWSELTEEEPEVSFLICSQIPNEMNCWRCAVAWNTKILNISPFL